MGRFRVSVAGLLLVVLVAGVGLAALRSPSPALAGTLLLLTLGLLGFATLGAVYRRGPQQAPWLGFALFGWGYLVLTGPAWWVPGPGRTELVTTPLLDRVRLLLRPDGPVGREPPPRELCLIGLNEPEFLDAKTKAIRAALERPIPMPFAQETPLDDVMKYVSSATQSAELSEGIPVYVDPRELAAARRTMMSPVTLNLDDVPLKLCLRLMLGQLGLGYRIEDGVLTIGLGRFSEEADEAFHRVGHALFALGAGSLGAIAGRMAHSRRGESLRDPAG